MRRCDSYSFSTMDELLLYNGKIHTIDDEQPSAEAVLTRGERIGFVGRAAEARRRASGAALVIDLQGRTLIPGFNDNHIHLIAMGDNLDRPNLRGMDAERIVEFLKEQFRDARPGESLYAWGWDYPSCPDPHRRILDEAFPDNPVVLIQFSGHGIWVNSSVLRKYRIDHRTPDPTGGAILRDEQGEPTGILRDSAAIPIHRARFLRMHTNAGVQGLLLDRALAEVARVGITSIQDNTWYPSTVSLLNRYRRKGRLTVRVSCWRSGMMPAAAARMSLKRFDNLWVRRGPWKYLLDGTFSTRTAWLLEAYNGQPGNYGIAQGVAELTDRAVRLSIRRRRQAAFHAIGDRTVRELVNAIERHSRRGEDVAALRLRIEHAQLIDPEDLLRLRDLGILVAAQPSALATPQKDAAVLGSQRAARAYPYRSLLDAGVHLSFGSDMPGEASFDPLLGMHYTVNRSGAERISPAEALRAYTLGSAYAEFQESEKGSITAGKLADLAVLSADPLSADPKSIRDIEVQMTILGGRVVYRRDDASAKTIPSVDVPPQD
jgi:predicted amidohydrolase YtcJ